ncbi:bifunctional diguanylate cyclase/phosphodiesterase [Micromonospora sp. NPDC049559]|uniref:putative bifunctional diguanylate cyclase/phosphodiesterase n=1 Tax=Micromonospora sp. NPDC049559 TaxID=3155923 RepID=UPI0034437545
MSDSRTDESLPVAGPAVVAFARSWLRVVARTSYVPGGRARARGLLERLTRRLLAALLAEPFDAAAGYGVGVELVRARISSPLALGNTIALLNGRLLGDLELADRVHRERLGELVGQLAAGFGEGIRSRARNDAEDLHRAERDVWRRQQRQLQDQIQHVLLHEPLTGLPNRAALAARLSEVLAGATGTERIGVCVIDLERFSAVNDSVGPAEGDRLLRAVGDQLRRLASTDDTFLAHLGGDEFAFVVERTSNADDVVKLVDRALRALPNPCRIGGHDIVVGAKAGIVERLAAGADPTELLRAADVALGWAKKDPHAQWAVFEPARNAVDVARHELTNAMPAALAAGEFTLAYQPLVRLRDRTVVGVEALARWSHPVFGPVSPSQFIPLAERTALIMPLGRHLLERACVQAASWQSAVGLGGELADPTPRQPMVSVNLAAAQLREPGLPAIVAAILDRTGLPAHRLQLEITENAILEPDQSTMRPLHALAELGVRLAIDDFGTGYSNLTYLHTMPVHTIKLAAAFLADLDRARAERSAARMVPHLIALGHDLRMEITAEGVESAAQADLLTALNCDIGQGHVLGRPMPPERIGELLAAGGRVDW